MRGARPIVVPLACGVALGACFAGTPVAGDFPGEGAVAWVALAPVLVGAVRSRALLAPVLASGACVATVLYWVPGALRHLGVTGAEGTGYALLVWIWCSAWPSAALYSAALLRRRRDLSIWVTLPPLLLFSELGSAVASGFDWMALGYTQCDLPGGFLVARILGAHGLSALVALSNAALAEWVLDRERPLAPAVVLGSLLASLVLLPVLGTGERRAGPSVRVAVLQGGSEVRSAGRIADVLATYTRLEAAASVANPAFVVWPEGGYPYLVRSKERLRHLARGSSTRVVGAVRQEMCGNRVCSHAAAIVAAPDASIVAMRDKELLVPMAEGRAAPWAAPGKLDPGGRDVLLRAAGVRIGSLICYEGQAPDIARRHTRLGAQLLIHQTSEMFHDGPEVAAQLLQIGRMRAMESGRAIVRASSVAYSTVLLPDGEVLWQMRPNQSGALVLNAPLIDEQTPFTVLGAGAGVGSWACLAVFFTLAVRRPGSTMPR